VWNAIDERLGLSGLAYPVPAHAGIGLLMLSAATVLTLIWPAGLGPRPVPGVEETKPPWMFLPFYSFEDWFGLASLLWVPVILFGGLALVLFIDRSPYRSAARRLAVVIVGAIVSLALVALVVYALVTVPQAHVQEAMVMTVVLIRVLLLAAGLGVTQIGLSGALVSGALGGWALVLVGLTLIVAGSAGFMVTLLGGARRRADTDA
jgi:quinol-cytochrome oxidoreductase complex cytochrome b subunit